MPQGPQNGPKVTRSVEFWFERDLRELEVGLVLKLEFELEAELQLALLRIELPQYLRRSATEAQLGLEFESAWSIEFEFEF